MESKGVDHLAIYGFSFDFPKTCRLEFNPKFKREEGDLAVKSPSKSNVFVSWGPLEKVRKKLATINDHAEYSLEIVRKSAQGKLDVLEHSEREVNGHKAIFNHVRVDVPRGGMLSRRTQIQEVLSLHLHCDLTSRFFVIYGATYPEDIEVQADTVSAVINSFRCH